MTCIDGFLGTSSSSVVFYKKSILNGGVDIASKTAQVGKLYSSNYSSRDGNQVTSYDVNPQSNENKKISSQQEIVDEY